MAFAMSISNFVWYVNTIGTWMRLRSSRARTADVTGQWQWMRSMGYSISVFTVFSETGKPA